MQTIPLAEFQATLRAQNVPRDDVAFKCPICSTVQSMRSLMAAGASADQAERQIGFSCEGRLTGVGAFPGSEKTAKAKARRLVRGCDWSLGGLFQLHQLEVIDNEGKAKPFFQIASAEEAQALASTLAK